MHLKRVETEKQTFIKSIPVFSQLTMSKLKSISSMFKTMFKQRGSVLFQEGEPVLGVFLVRSGEFKLFKKIYTEALKFEQKSDLIFKDPMRANKLNSKHHFKNEAPLVKN